MCLKSKGNINLVLNEVFTEKGWIGSLCASHTYIVHQDFKFVFVDPSSSVNREPDHDDSRFVHGETDGVRGAVSSIPAPALTGFCKSIWAGLDRMQGAESIGLERRKSKLRQDLTAKDLR